MSQKSSPRTQLDSDPWWLQTSVVHDEPYSPIGVRRAVGAMHRPVWLEHPVWECLQVARPSRISLSFSGYSHHSLLQERHSVHHAQALLVQHNHQRRHHFCKVKYIVYFNFYVVFKQFVSIV
ncbi:hypothetical protein TNCT_72001 [Trichonephila clavata]|uniref:Uncharacterized protein n=1 Tax=Trichonephila clavata TaxID=2740835 RepID=A0A8X6JEU9_TRICU|nr:hypothetical protein TNCT_72001 [Trichonephila clavata]